MIKENIKIKYFKYCLISILLIFFLNYFRNYLINFFDLSMKVPKKIDLLFFLNVVLLGPLKEENIFRSLLIINTKNIILFLITLLLSIVRFIFPKYIILIDIIIVIISLLLYKVYIQQNEGYPSKKFNFYLVYLFSLLFWVFHFWNYQEINFKLIIATVPIFFSSIILSYLRLKLNLLTSLLTHILYNLIAFLIYLY